MMGPIPRDITGGWWKGGRERESEWRGGRQKRREDRHNKEVKKNKTRRRKKTQQNPKDRFDTFWI